MAITGNIIPESGYKTVVSPNGRVNRLAVNLLVDIVYWYRPMEIRGLGGIPQENVTRETDYLVVGHYRKNTIIGDKSNKRILAERYIRQGCGIKIIREDQFLQMLWFAPAEATGK